MNEPRDPLMRIADALERLAPPATDAIDWLGAPAYVWDGRSANAVGTILAPNLDQLRAIDRQKEALHTNITRHAQGLAAHDALLWGARGMGKSALLRAVVHDVQSQDAAALGLVQVSANALETLPGLFRTLGDMPRQFVIFIDDLGFSDDDTIGPRRLRSWLEGGIEARAPNCRLVVTSNRRAVIAREAGEQDSESTHSALNPRDAVDDKLALSDRFGLSLGFHPCSKDDYLAIVAGYAEPLGLFYDEEEAMAWSRSRGALSGRVAWQFVVEIAGRAGKALT